MKAQQLTTEQLSYLFNNDALHLIEDWDPNNIPRHLRPKKDSKNFASTTRPGQYFFLKEKYGPFVKNHANHLFDVKTCFEYNLYTNESLCFDNKLIPIKDRLPNAYKRVLLFVERNGKYKEFYIGMMQDDGKFLIFGIEAKSIKIISWSKLPEL